MTIDTHIKFEGIQGESTHKDHKDEIDLLGWSWGVSNPPSVGGGGLGLGKAVPGEFTISKLYDKASPLLARRSAEGKHIPTATITVRKAGEGQKDYLIVKFKTLFVTAVQQSASSGGEIAESVSFIFEDVEFEYKTQDDKGNLGGSTKFGWNVKTTEIR